MALFRKEPVASAEEQSAADDKATNKGHATPTRRQQEAARKRPLVGDKTPEGRRMARDQAAAQRQRARIGMENGEEKFLPQRDRGAQKRYVRDYIDARYSVGELAIPLLVVLLIASLFGQTIVEIVTISLYAYLVLVAIDVIVLQVRLRRRLADKFGRENLERIGMYATMRSIQFRRLRLPKPQVKRMQFPK